MHTPGPWRTGGEQDYSVDRYARGAEWARVRAADGALVAKVESTHPKGHRQAADFDIEAANAILLASAPELLEALRRISDMAFDDPSQPLGHVAGIARDAIKKAEGGEHENWLRASHSPEYLSDMEA